MPNLCFQDPNASITKIIFTIQHLLKHYDIPVSQFLTKIYVLKLSFIPSFRGKRGDSLIEIISIEFSAGGCVLLLRIVTNIKKVSI